MHEPIRRSGHSAAVIGAGPAGLSCAERLNRAGMEVIVYDLLGQDRRLAAECRTHVQAGQAAIAAPAGNA